MSLLITPLTEEERGALEEAFLNATDEFEQAHGLDAANEARVWLAGILERVDEVMNPTGPGREVIHVPEFEGESLSRKLARLARKPNVYLGDQNATKVSNWALALDERVEDLSDMVLVLCLLGNNSFLESLYEPEADPDTDYERGDESGPEPEPET